MIVKYRVDGLLSGISFVSTVAVFLLLIRYTNTTISLSSIVGMIILAITETYFIISILNKIKKDNTYETVLDATINTYTNNIELIIVLLIIAVVFTFMPEATIFSLGMTLFYGIISIAISNLVFMRTMLIAKYKQR